MSVEDLEKILINISKSKGTVINSNLSIIMTAHYNELLLYKYFPEMLALFKNMDIKP